MPWAVTVNVGFVGNPFRESPQPLQGSGTQLAEPSEQGLFLGDSRGESHQDNLQQGFPKVWCVTCFIRSFPGSVTLGFSYSCMNTANLQSRSAMGSLSPPAPEAPDSHLSTAGVVMWSRKVDLQLEFSLLKIPRKTQLGLNSLVCAAAWV